MSGFRLSLSGAAAAVAALGGCAQSGPFPSLAERPAERAYAEEASRAPQPPPALPDDPAVARQIAALREEARAGQAEFDGAYGPAASAATRAGAPGSESWVEAQQLLSRATAAQARTARAVSDLDRYAIERASGAPLGEADMDRLRGAAADLQALAQGQTGRLERLEASLRR